MKEKFSISRREFLRRSGRTISAVVVGGAVYDTGKKIYRILNPQSPKVDLPGLPENPDVQVGEYSAIEFPIPEDITLSREITQDTAIEIKEPLKEFRSLSIENAAKSETSFMIGNINLAKPHVKRLPIETALTANMGAKVTHRINPGKIVGSSWGDPKNKEVIYKFNNLKDNLEGTLDDALFLHTKIPGSKLMMGHSYTQGGVILNGDAERRASENYMNKVPGKNIIGHSIFLHQEGEVPLELEVYSVIVITADSFAESFIPGKNGDPMIFDSESLGIPNPRPGQLHIVACYPGNSSRTYYRYVLSCETLGLASVISREIFGRA